MHFPLVQVVALSALALCLSGLTVDRCQLRDQVGPLFSSEPGAMKEQLLATGLCEVENFDMSVRARREAGRGGRGRSRGRSEENSSSQEDSSEESKQDQSSEEVRTKLTLSDCAGVLGGNVTVDAKCLSLIFKSLCKNASDDCKTVDPEFFFQNCTVALS